MKRIGIFVCHCGNNIAGTVDVEQVCKALKDYPGVHFVTNYRYMCSNPGQELIKDTIEQEGLEGVVVAACSPTLHESTFRVAVRGVGMNPYMVEIANIREQCSWVHVDRSVATEKAIWIISSMVEKTLGNDKLEPISVPITERAFSAMQPAT